MLWHEKGFYVSAFELQQVDFLVDAAGVSCQAAAFADDAVAGDDEGDLVVADGTSDGMSGHVGEAALGGDFLGDFAIRRCLSVGDLEQDLPDVFLERRADHVERRQEVGLFAREIIIEPFSRLLDGRRFFLCVLGGELLGIVFLVVEPEPCQSFVIRGQQDFAERGLVGCCILHGVSLLSDALKSFLCRRFLAWRGVFQPGDCAAGDGPEVEACDAAVRAQALAIALEFFAVDGAMAVDYAHAAQDGEVAVAQDVRPLEAEQQDHLGGPDADAAERAKRVDGLFVGHVLHGFDVKRAALHLACEVEDVIGLFECRAE